MPSSTTDQAVEKITAELKQWRFGPGRGSLILPERTFKSAPERNISLKGLKLRKLLQWKHEMFGINLDWSSNAEPETEVMLRRWFLARPGDQNKPITYAEPVALANGEGESFLRYRRRTIGINLSWSAEPVYEWKVLGGTPGQPVRTGDNVAIFNTSVDGTGGPNGDFFVYFDRPAGADIGWTTSPSWLDSLGELGKELLGDDAWRAAALAAFGL
jgi:hypothetical protein